MPFSELIIEPLQTEREGRQCFKLVVPFSYEIQALGVKCRVDIPAGYITDFASVPRIFWRLIPPTGTYSRSAVVHDYLCDIHIDQPLADAIFLAAMKEDGVAMWKRTVIYYAVRTYQTMCAMIGVARRNKDVS